MIKAGIFDVGGVLIQADTSRTAGDIMRVFKLSKKEYAVVEKDIVPLLDKGNIAEKEFLLRVQQLSKGKAEFPSTLLLDSLRADCTRNENVLSLVKKLKKKGLKLAVLSNTIATHVAYLQQMRVYEHFDECIFSHEVGFAKPDKQIYQLTLSKLHVKPEETFYVDDSLEFVEVARGLGIQSFHYSTFPRLVNDFRRNGLMEYIQ